MLQYLKTTHAYRVINYMWLNVMNEKENGRYLVGGLVPIADEQREVAVGVGVGDGDARPLVHVQGPEAAGRFVELR